MDIIIRQQRLGDIACLEVFKDDGILRKPLVIEFHGYTGVKEHFLVQAYNLAREGFFVVLPDACNHGERWVNGTVFDFFDAILKTADEIDTLIDSYADNEAVNIERTGLAGYSMGGCIIYSYLTRNKREIKTAVPVIGTPDWASLIRTQEAATILKRVGMAKSDEDMDRFVEIALKIQPLNKYEAMDSIPLLILNTEADAIIPVGPVREFYSNLQKISSCREDIRFIVYPEVGHACIPEMDLEILSWFKKYL